MTRRQFLKKSNATLDDSSTIILLLLSLFQKEKARSNDKDKNIKELDRLRNDLEIIFEKYNGIKAPSKCKSINRRIINFLISFQDLLTFNREYLNKSSLRETDETLKILEEFGHQLEDLRLDFREISTLVRKELRKK